MPNWTETEMAVVLPTRNVKAFKDLFLSQNPKENEGKKEYFGRTFIDDSSEEKNKLGLSCLHVTCECAWSAYSCLIEGYPGGDGHHCPTIKEAIDKNEVKRLTLYSKEPGIGFEETMTFDREKSPEVKYESRDLFPDPWNEAAFDDEADENSPAEKGGDGPSM
jgi:hypothetical protein